MTDKEKKQKENLEAFKDIASNYWNTFVYFNEVSGDIGQAFRLTHDMFSAVFSQNRSNESKAALPPGFFDMTKGGPVS